MTGQKIGVIGLGAIGGPLAANIQKKLPDIMVFDRDENAMERFARLGAEPAASVAELAGHCDVIVTILPNGDIVEDVLLGPDGVAANGRSGQVVIDISTINPLTTDKVAAELAGSGIDFVDSPVGRTVKDAAAGTSLFMVGGSDEAVARVRPILETMADTIHHCGGVGSGIRTKIVNNYVAIVGAQMCAEAMAMTAKFGLDLQKTMDVLNGTTSLTGHLKNVWPNKVLAGDVDPGFRISLAHKDLKLGVQAARDAGIDVSLGPVAETCFSDAMEHGDYRNQDYTAMLDFLAERSGMGKPRLP